MFRERLGRESEELTLGEGAKVADAIAALAEAHPPIAALRGRFRAAVNHSFVGEDEPLADGDELALIPPVAGGADDVEPAPRRAHLVTTPPSLDRVVAAVTSPEFGAVATFTGMVRRHNQGREVERLEYEAYEPMVNKVFADLCDELEREFSGVRVAIEHRAGKLDIGDVAVVIAVGSPHRAESFDACRAAIERLKERAPIWKKEIGPTGEEWIGLGP